MTRSSRRPRRTPAHGAGGETAPSTATRVSEGPTVAGAERLTLLHALAPARFGGLERIVHALATGHAEAGHDIHIAAILSGEDPDAHPFVRSFEPTEVCVHAADLPARGYVREWTLLRRLCRDLRPDVVHTHGYRSDVIDGEAARMLGIPTLSSVHGFTGGGWKDRIYERIQRWAYRRMDAVVAVSRAQVVDLVASGVPSDRIEVLQNAWTGPDGALPADDARARLDVSGADFHVGWVGRLGREKGCDVLIDALPRLRDLEPVVSVLGTGRDLQALRRRADRLGVSELLRWHGEVDRAGRLFAAFDVFVLSSRTEGTPVALFEAMAAGAPIVASAVGGVPDVVTEREALLVPPAAPGALAAAIRSVHERPEDARRRARAARRRLAGRFDRDAWLARYEALYRRLRHERSPLRPRSR